ncbi:unnamed protein product [Acanthoscelides obtectus]|uniref:Uncharacterized protein n=1 Tax=Acanthoscelides obtectus TaxID=200917 RepID=A0A9P0P3I5_ACAOB|nr:unnamed protein product [Acanthoscelides obtectus]CAK1622989.1 hypothetical protein AOBTE_LOCUS1761 [Acanthoscelides obtectus]
MIEAVCEGVSLSQSAKVKGLFSAPKQDGRRLEAQDRHRPLEAKREEAVKVVEEMKRKGVIELRSSP